MSFLRSVVDACLLASRLRLGGRGLSGGAAGDGGLLSHEVGELL